MEIRAFTKIEDLADCPRTKSVVNYAGGNPFSDQPDLHLLAIIDCEALACCSLWWNRCPKLENERIGCIGHFFATDESSGMQLLAKACEQLKRQGATLAVGPMNGNTWRKYRFVTDAGSMEPFALEPENPSWWPELWTRFGFSKLAGYHSRVIENLDYADSRIARACERLAQAGVSIRELNIGDYENELSRIYSVSESSFASNFLYTPLPQKAFIDMYRPLRDFVDPRFTLLAEQDRQTIGFVFSFRDDFQSRDTDAGDTLIIKTLATLPGRKWAGLGTVLVDRIREAAANSGIKRVIHALMYDHNNSANIGKNSRIIRRYTLYSRRLDP